MDKPFNPQDLSFLTRVVKAEPQDSYLVLVLDDGKVVQFRPSPYETLVYEFGTFNGRGQFVSAPYRERQEYELRNGSVGNYSVDPDYT